MVFQTGSVDGRMFKNNETLLERFFGLCESLMCYATLLFDEKANPGRLIVNL